MEPTFPLNNLKTQLCVMAVGYGPELDREAVWPEGAEIFLKRLHKLGVHITVVGPRPPFKLGTKKTVRYLDRHEVVGMKWLAVSRQYRIEVRILNRKMKGWTRLRAEACLAFGPHGILPLNYDGWNSPGTMTLPALSRWLLEQKTLPGMDFALIGSSNQSLRWAQRLLNQGARHVYVIEGDAKARCWRSHADRFVARGGFLLPGHALMRAEAQPNNTVNLYLDNHHGTRVITVNTVVLAAVNDDVFNSPAQWKQGMFYLQRRMIPGEPLVDEERWLELGDWAEALWRVAKFLGHAEHAEAEGAIKRGRLERRHMLEYRRAESVSALRYSGKILDRDTLAMVQSSRSVPRSFAAAKPVASLECFEAVACRACADACPEGAIEFPRLLDQPVLTESKCTGCGACVAVCPSSAAVMLKELPAQQRGRYFLPDDSKELWRPSTQLQLLNRRGEFLGTGRVVASTSHQGGAHRVLEIESSNVYLWDARTFKALKPTDVGAPDALHTSEEQQRRGWITLNGVKRLSPVNVPISVALWQMGQRRFEDGLFCYDGSCKLCEVQVNGKRVLGCKTKVEEGQEIQFAKSEPPKGNRTLCACKKVTEARRAELLAEGASEELMRELTGMASGTCHGRWCLSSNSLVADGEKPRPVFHGYEMSPWRDIWAEDVIDHPHAHEAGADDPEAASSFTDLDEDEEE